MKHLLLASLFAAALLQPAFAAPAEMTTGEVRKIDKDSKKITIRHAEIKSLEMPPMTMVFQVKDPAWLDSYKPGDAIRFSVEKSPGGALVVTDIQPGK